MPAHAAALRSLAALVIPALLTGGVLPSLVRADGKFELTVVDPDTGQPIPCRMHLKGPNGKSRRVNGLPNWHDHFVFPGKVLFKLPPGTYTFELERGPEYVMHTGHFIIDRFSDDARTVDLKRYANMAEEGWWSGDLHVHRPPEDIELLMQAEDLHVAPVITWWNARNVWDKRELPERPLVRFDQDRYYHLLAGEDERGGGALLYFNLTRPLQIAAAQREYPSSMEFLLAAARIEGSWIDVEKPFWWDVPMWLASGEVDSIGLANNHLERDKTRDNEAWGRPRDKQRFPAPWGDGLWSQEIYYHVLNCGLRIPPSAGSASGVINNPVGYNRVYVHCGEDFTYESWWENFRAGRVMVTNGPMLRPLVNGEHYPGHVFAAPAGEGVDLEIALNLGTRERIGYLELIHNGRVERSVRLDDVVSNRGRLPPLRLTESGWFLIRAVTDVEATYRFASTGPYYLEIGDAPRRISRASAQFFLDWVNERAGQIQLDDPAQQREVQGRLDDARAFWEDLVQRSNAE